MPTVTRFPTPIPLARLVTGLLVLGASLSMAQASQAQSCGGENEQPCSIDTGFFWSNGNLFCDRGLEATGFNVLPDVTYNFNDWADLNQADFTEMRILVTDEWAALAQRANTLSASDFVSSQCVPPLIKQNGRCWLVPPTPPLEVPGKKVGGVCVPTGELDSCTIWNPFGDDVAGYKVGGICVPTGELANCNVTIPGQNGVEGASVPIPDFTRSGWDFAVDATLYFDRLAKTATTTLGQMPSSVVQDVPALPINPFDVLTPTNFDPTLLTHLGLYLDGAKQVFSQNAYVETLQDLVQDFADPPGLCVNHTRRQPYAGQFQDSWTYRAIMNQRELAQDEPINWMMHLSTHNTFNNTADGYPVPNQYYSLTDQLRLGARALSLDAHWFANQMRLCHGKPDHGGCAAMDRFLSSGLKELADWLHDNPGEVIIINLENRLDGRDDDAADLIAQYFGDLVYRPDDVPAHLATGPLDLTTLASVHDVALRWPTLRELRALGKQVLIFNLDPETGWGWPTQEAGGKANELSVNGALASCNLGLAGVSPEVANGTFYAVYETRSLLDPFEPAGLLDEQLVAGLARCNVNFIGLDFLQSKQHTSSNVCTSEYQRVLAETGNQQLANQVLANCASSDDRMSSAVWSWATGDYGQHGSYAALSMADQRWHSTGGSDTHRFACARPRPRPTEANPTPWTDSMGQQWQVTQATGAWNEGEAACAAEFGDSLAFAVPVNGWQNEQLKAAAQAAGLGTGESVWLDYRKTNGTWTPDNEALFVSALYTFVGDADGDGQDDLLHNQLSTSFNQLQVALSDESGTPGTWFSQMHPVQSAAWIGYEPQIGDVNGDDRMDIIWNYKHDTNLFKVALANSDGTFSFGGTQQMTALEPWQAYETHVGDIDGDGRADLIWNRREGGLNRLIFFRGQSNGTFYLPNILNLGSYLAHHGASETAWDSYELQTGDVNGDGRTDLVWNRRTQDANELYVGLGQSNGTFDLSLPKQQHPEASPDWSEYTLHMADIDGDEQADLAWNHLLDGTNVLHIARSNGDGTFDVSQPAQTHPVTTPSWSDFEVQVGDVNGDSLADLIWNKRTASDNIWYVGLGRDDAAFDLSPPMQTHAAQAAWPDYTFLTGDMNGDGFTDLIWYDPTAEPATYIEFSTPGSHDLPVELVRFETVADGADVRLEWETASEQSNAGFEVQMRDTAGEQEEESVWQVVHFVEGHGTTNDRQAYTYRIESLAPGTHVFRLKQIDFDGAYDYSPEVEQVVTLPDAYALSSVYPNPFNPQAQFTLAVQQAQPVTVELYNLLGQRVLTLHEGNLEPNRVHTFVIDGSRLGSGMYLLRASSAAFVETQKVTLIK